MNVLIRRSAATLLMSGMLGFSTSANTGAQKPAKPTDPPVNVHYTDIRKAAGITFVQDSTQTEEKYYLETMGTGVAWLDYDQDGLMDLFLVQSAATDIYKPPQPLRCALYHNNGDSTFTDVTEKAGVAGVGHYGQGVAVGDFDSDGYPDLYVTGYGSAILYHNNRDGTFTDVTEASGVSKPESKGMGVVLADFNNDGWTDIAIANDSWPNFIFLNKHDGTFEDASFVSGMAASEDGRYEAGMGIDAADVDRDGWLDVYIPHLDFELNRLYHNNHNGTFDDYTYPSGIGNKVMLLSGVSMKFLDFDNDGWPDIVQANGAMVDNVELYHSEVSYKEPLLMLRNGGKGQFEKVSESLGQDFMRPMAGRGLAIADFDNDGDIDIAVNIRGDYPAVLRNDGGNANHWVEVLLIGTQSNRDGIGSSLKLVSEGFVEVEQAK